MLTLTNIFAARRGIGCFGDIAFLIIFVLSIVSWAILIAIAAAFINGACSILRLITDKQDLCEAFSRLLGFF